MEASSSLLDHDMSVASEEQLWKLTSTSCTTVAAVAIAVAATIVAAAAAVAAVPTICSIGSEGPVSTNLQAVRLAAVCRTLRASANATTAGSTTEGDAKQKCIRPQGGDHA